MVLALSIEKINQAIRDGNQDSLLTIFALAATMSMADYSCVL
jgi:hypothetical protein